MNAAAAQLATRTGHSPAACALVLAAAGGDLPLAEAMLAEAARQTPDPRQQLHRVVSLIRAARDGSAGPRTTEAIRLISSAGRAYLVTLREWSGGWSYQTAVGADPEHPLEMESSLFPRWELALADAGEGVDVWDRMLLGAE